MTGRPRASLSAPKPVTATAAKLSPSSARSDVYVASGTPSDLRAATRRGTTALTLGFSLLNRCRSMAIAIVTERHMSESQRSVPALRRTLRRHELRDLVPLSDTTIYEMEQRGEFPRRFHLTPRCVAWDYAEIAAWLAERRHGADNGQSTRAPIPNVRMRRTRPVKA
jgi:prophage regulatory protein